MDAIFGLTDVQGYLIVGLVSAAAGVLGLWVAGRASTKATTTAAEVADVTTRLDLALQGQGALIDDQREQIHDLRTELAELRDELAEHRRDLAECHRERSELAKRVRELERA